MKQAFVFEQTVPLLLKGCAVSHPEVIQDIEHYIPDIKPNPSKVLDLHREWHGSRQWFGRERDESQVACAIVPGVFHSRGFAGELRQAFPVVYKHPLILISWHPICAIFDLERFADISDILSEADPAELEFGTIHQRARFHKSLINILDYVGQHRILLPSFTFETYSTICLFGKLSRSKMALMADDFGILNSVSYLQ